MASNRCERGVAIVTQSGNIACNFTMTRRALPLAAVFAIGNQADVDMAQMLEALADDDRITAIGLHIEGLPDVAALRPTPPPRRAREKPVVVLKTGRCEQGAKVALSHTAFARRRRRALRRAVRALRHRARGLRHRLRRDAEIPPPSAGR